MAKAPPDASPENPFVARNRRPRFAPIEHKHPVPTAAPSAGGGAGCCFSREYIPYLAPMFEIWAQDDFWEGTEEEVQQAKDWMSQLEDMLTMAGQCGPSTTPRVDAATILLRQLFQDQFDAGGLDEVAPDRPDTSFDEDTGDSGDEVLQRETALCLACQDYVSQTMLQARDSLLDAGLSVFTGSPITLIVGMPGVIIVGGLLTLFGLSFVALSRIDVRDAIACCLRDGLSGQDITEANFAAALDGACEVPLSPLGDAVHLFIKSTLDDDPNYLSFVRTLGAFNDVARSGFIDCACDTWEHVFDFEISDQGWETMLEDARDHGVYSAGVGWLSEFEEQGGVVAERLYIQIDGWSERVLTSVAAEWLVDDGSFAGRNANVILRLADAVQDQENLTAFPQPGVVEVTWIGLETADEVETVMVDGLPAEVDRVYILKKVTVRGLGTDPF